MLMTIGGSAMAHQFVPTHPKFDISFVEGVWYTKMELFNKRSDVQFYELSVYDKEWKSIPFASESVLMRVKYLETKKVNVYIKEEDLKNVTYICSESRILKDSIQGTAVTSRICSKVNR